MNTGSFSAPKMSERSTAANHLTLDAETALPLLQRMLSLVRRSRETPLQFEIDSERIAAAALDEFGGSYLFQHTRLTQDLAILNQLIHRILSGEGEPLKVDRGPARVGSIAAWLEQVYQLARAIHPQAIDMLGLRLQGFESRDIAEHLVLGRRLVQRVLSDMQVEWTRINVNN